MFPNIHVDASQLSEKVELLGLRSDNMMDKAVLSNIFSLIDLTSLSPADSERTITDLTEKVNRVNDRFPRLQNIAALCVYPSMVPVVRRTLKADKVKISSIIASLPGMKPEDIQSTINDGADEIDVAIPVGKFMDGDYDFVSDELRKMKEAIGRVPMKVDLETETIQRLDLIRIAALLALEAGADFLVEKQANPESVWVICEAIRDYARNTGRMVGIKPSGGISDIRIALQHYLIVVEVLGNEWLKPERFRIGTSKLVNFLIGEKYF
jgi:deoxyribose-phosphate aldolase